MSPQQSRPSAFARLVQRLDALSLRERLLVAASALAVITALWLLLVQNGLDAERNSLAQQREGLLAEQALQQAQLALLSGAPGTEQTRAQQRQLDNLRGQLSTLDERLTGLSRQLVSAEQLPKILEDVLLTSSQLRLIQLQTLPVQALSLAPGDNGAAELETGVYQHRVSLRVSGSYFQVVEFLQALEALPWRFYWEQLDYRVGQYPEAEIDIQVYTLSAEEGLLGV